MNTTINRIDLANQQHQAALVGLLDHYATDIMGGGNSLPGQVRETLIDKLRREPGFVGFLAYRDGQPLGLAICFRGFSTFRAAPVLNIHDLAVHASVRGQGIGRQLLTTIEQQAKASGCCKLTLEVRTDNAVARHLYDDFGFDPGDPTSTAMLFWSKTLD